MNGDALAPFGSTLGPNLIINADFSSGESNWSVTLQVGTQINHDTSRRRRSPGRRDLHAGDEIRICEAQGDFGLRFIDLARAVYTKNDHRARIKRQIDERCGAAGTEEKIYSIPQQ